MSGCLDVRDDSFGDAISRKGSKKNTSWISLAGQRQVRQKAQYIATALACQLQDVVDCRELGAVQLGSRFKKEVTGKSPLDSSGRVAEPRGIVPRILDIAFSCQGIAVEMFPAKGHLLLQVVVGHTAYHADQLTGCLAAGHWQTAYGGHFCTRLGHRHGRESAVLQAARKRVLWILRPETALNMKK